MCGHTILNSFFLNLAVCLCSQNSPATVVGLLDHISVLNRDPDVHGVIVQLPLPLHLNEEVVCNAVDVTKDVDGFTTTNLGSLVQGVSLGRSFVPCTPLAVLKILQTSVDIPFKGLNAVVAGRSHNVGLPIAIILATDAIKEIQTESI